MSEHQPKKCMVNFKNTEEQISVELIYKKRDKDVDIRDFFSKIKEISALEKVEVHFRKGHYQLIDRGQEDVLNLVPEVIEIFQHFYEASFGGNAQKNVYTEARTREHVHHDNEQTKSKAHATSENHSGHSYNGSALGHSQLQKEKGTQTESELGSSGLANRAYTDEDERAAGSQNTDDGSMANVGKSDIKSAGTTHGCKQHDLKAANKYPNPKPESGEEHTAKETKKSDYNGRKKEKDNKDEKQDDQDDGKHHNRSKEGQKNSSTTRNKTPEHKAELDDQQKAKNDSNGKEEKKKGKNDGEQIKKNTSHDDDTDYKGHACESNNEETGIPQGSKGHDESGLQMNSKTTKMMHKNDALDGDKDRRPAGDAKAKSRDSSAEAKLRDSSAKAKSRDSSAEAKLRDSSAKAKSRDSSAEAKLRDASAEAKLRDASAEAKLCDSSAEAKSRDASTKAKSRDASAEAKSRDASAEAKSRDASTKAKSRDASAEAKSRDSSAEAKSRDASTKAKSRDASAKAKSSKECGENCIADETSKQNQDAQQEFF